MHDFPGGFGLGPPGGKSGSPRCAAVTHIADSSCAGSNVLEPLGVVYVCIPPCGSSSSHPNFLKSRSPSDYSNCAVNAFTTNPATGNREPRDLTLTNCVCSLTCRRVVLCQWVVVLRFPDSKNGNIRILKKPQTPFPPRDNFVSEQDHGLFPKAVLLRVFMKKTAEEIL